MWKNSAEFLTFYNEECVKCNKPFVIAEIGVNHENSIDLAKKLIDEAQESGANAAKFQSYKAETLASRYSPAYWDISKEPTLSQFELFKKHDKFWKEEFIELKNICDKSGIEFMSTPFDIESSNFLNPIVNSFKISSSDITNKPFIKHISNFNKPIILSTGASNKEEIVNATNWIGSKNLICLMHCVLNYPTKRENANLRRISALIRTFPKITIGYSDHTLPENMDLLEKAFLLGAIVIEKHFTHDKSLPGNDHYHAMDKTDLKRFIKRLDRIKSDLGHLTLNYQETERISRQNARRSLVLTRNLKKGIELKESDLTWKRPANGISPQHIEQVIGSRLRKDMSIDSILNWTDIDKKR